MPQYGFDAEEEDNQPDTHQNPQKTHPTGEFVVVVKMVTIRLGSRLVTGQ